MITGAKTKGYLRNTSNGEMRKFMFNPEQIAYNVSNNINALNSPGLNYPLVEYTGGDTVGHSFSLLLKGNETQSNIDFLESLASTSTFGELPIVLWVMGSSVKKVYVHKLGITKTEFDQDLKCTGATVDIDLLEVK